VIVSGSIDSGFAEISAVDTGVDVVDDVVGVVVDDVDDGSGFRG